MKNLLLNFLINQKNRKFQYVIENKNDNKIIGLIYCHSLNTTNKNCFINLYIDEEYEVKGYGVQSFGLFLEMLFEQENMYKVYMEVYSNNRLSLSSLESCKFEKEGIFKGHVMLHNEKIDLIRFAAYEESLILFKKILKRYV